MTASNNSSDLKKFISNYIDLAYELDSDDINSKKKILAEEGIDIENILLRQMEVINAFKSKYLLHNAKTNHNSVVKQITEKDMVQSPSTREEKLLVLSKLMSGESSSLAIQTYFHKFESLNDEDLDGMIEDTQLLEIFINQKKVKK